MIATKAPSWIQQVGITKRGQVPCKIDCDLLGNVAVSDAQRLGFAVGARIWLFQIVRNLLFRFGNCLERVSTYGDKERSTPSSVKAPRRTSGS